MCVRGQALLLLKPIILAIQKPEIRKIMVRGQPRHEVCKLGTVACACHHTYTEKHYRRITVQA
jgi:hypothetical protein